MIRIRTITYHIPAQLDREVRHRIRKCRDLFASVPYEVHTQRVCCTPVPELNERFVAEVAAFCEGEGIRWFNLPVDLWQAGSITNRDITHVLNKYKNAFVNVICAREGRIRSEIVDFAARQFSENAAIDPDGLINFRFGASMNIQPNSPFFPFAYSGGELSFSIGLEIAEEINRVLNEHVGLRDLNRLREVITQTLEPQIARIEALAQRISEESGLIYHGMDFSLAPLPRENNSVISILNALGVNRIDDTGVLFVTAFLTQLLKAFAHRYKSVGFSGVMYSLIEDHLYAQSNNQHGFSIDRMIALSTMCGCGVDMVPVPYDAPARALRTILLETACVSSRLKKPLGVRLLPVKSDDGFTHFTMEEDFCINTKIVPLDSQSDIQFDDVFSFEVQSLLEN